MILDAVIAFIATTTLTVGSSGSGRSGGCCYEYIPNLIKSA